MAQLEDSMQCLARLKGHLRQIMQTPQPRETVETTVLLDVDMCDTEDEKPLPEALRIKYAITGVK